MRVEIEADGIYITKDNGEEVVMWDEQEWRDDPTVVPAIANAVRLALTNPADLRDKLSIWNKERL